ncbi:MAG: M15 family metallopeptidase [Actinobacteria bacterium]|nr:M15 family metallopeptidase [Actinomycetota bacterium]MCA1720838.1 M15 family metallopeptidase [Actinomycetota bacterium]
MSLRLLTLAVLASTALGTAPALAASPSPSPSPSGSPRPSASPTPPSAAVAEKEVKRQQVALTNETQRLRRAATVATATLQAYQEAQRAAEDATQHAIAESVRSTTAQRRAEKARRELLGYAGSLYRTGMVDSQLLILTDALASEDPQQLFGGLGLVKRVGTSRSHALDEMAAAQSEATTAAASAKDSAEASAKASVKAAQAKQKADVVVAAYAHQVIARRIALARTTGVLQAAKDREKNIASAEAAARAAGWVPMPDCAGADVSGFPNGQIPPEALCPLWFTAGHRLRADAAAAFKPMAIEYAATFGTPLCVTDSYRTLDAQVAVKAEKPTLAATPGMSNHGWGLATDLCDGIQVFDTPTHQWMLDNALRFGWFHPSWAEADGAKPEAWHWEFAG